MEVRLDERQCLVSEVSDPQAAEQEPVSVMIFPLSEDLL